MVSLWNDIRLSESKPPMGFINPFLYWAAKNYPAAFNDITSGDISCGQYGQRCCSSIFGATTGWDAASGLGTPKFNLMSQLVRRNYTEVPTTPVLTGSGLPEPGTTGTPSGTPTAKPSAYPTRKPTKRPTQYPSRKPTMKPSLRPTAWPAVAPSTTRPTIRPSTSRPISTRPSTRPTTSRPTYRPTTSNNNALYNRPTSKPSRLPTQKPK